MAPAGGVPTRLLAAYAAPVPPQPTPTPPADEGGAALLAASLVEEACKRSGLLWVRVGGSRPRALWHAWAEGAAWVVVGGGEQEHPGLEEAGTVGVLVRSKDKGGRLVAWEARVVPVAPDDERWEPGVTALLAARLNAPDGEDARTRWAEVAVVLMLEPTGRAAPTHGVDEGSQAAPPPPSPATTRTPLPWVLGRREGREGRPGGRLRRWRRSPAPRP